MTLVVSIGGALLSAALPSSVAAGGALAAGAGAGVGAAGGALSGALIGSTAAGLSGLGAGVAGTIGAGTLAGAGLAANEMMKGPPTSAPNTPTLAPGLSPAMTAGQVYSPATVAAVAPMGGLASIGQEERKAATGGVMLARGGHVPLKNGAYIIPADVVSALGNGSSKAGAEFLRRLMDEVKREAVGRHGLGAVKRDAA